MTVMDAIIELVVWAAFAAAAVIAAVAAISFVAFPFVAIIYAKEIRLAVGGDWVTTLAVLEIGSVGWIFYLWLTNRR